MINVIAFILYIPVFIIKFVLGLVVSIVLGLILTLFSGPDSAIETMRSIWSWVFNGEGLFGGE